MTQLNPITSHAVDYQMNDAIIHISNLRLRTFIGFNPEELSKQQDIVINAEIHYSADEACDSDDESRALNYKLVCKSLIEHVENGRFRLLEKLVSDLLAIIMATKQVEYASIRVDKPHALRFADSVSLSLSARR
jgi:D-erythro-7,8-dihydroneopterin triphosphate epimerase